MKSTVSRGHKLTKAAVFYMFYLLMARGKANVFKTILQFRQSNIKKHGEIHMKCACTWIGCNAIQTGMMPVPSLAMRFGPTCSAIEAAAALKDVQSKPA